MEARNRSTQLSNTVIEVVYLQRCNLLTLLPSALMHRSDCIFRIWLAERLGLQALTQSGADVPDTDGFACLAIDPGHNSGVSLVIPGATRPRLLWAEEASGTTPASLRRSLHQACQRAFSHWSFERYGKLICAIEVPQPQTRPGKSKVDTWVGIGISIGISMCVLEDIRRSSGCSSRQISSPKRIRQRNWAVHWRVSKGKKAGGLHRILEARSAIDQASQVKSVDVAEACLLAGAVATGLKF